MVEIKPDVETFARIKVVGVGGSGSNAVSRMVESQMTGVEFMVVNTDAQALHHSLADEKIHIGKNLTQGLGAGMNPEIGRQAAEENRDEIHEALKGVNMAFIVYGAGGGTGSGAGPVIAEAAKEAGALTIGVVTKPFSFEGKQRAMIADESIENLRERVDTLIVIQNDKLLHMIDKSTSLIESFRIVDDVLRQGVQGISDLITKPGIVNLDFADINTVMKESGNALMGVGVASGEDRAAQAAKSAINSPLLNVSIEGAKGVLFNISGSDNDLTLAEINEAAELITENVDPNARIIFGASVDEQANEGEIRVTVIATGFDFDSRSSNDDLLSGRKPYLREKKEKTRQEHKEKINEQKGDKLSVKGDKEIKEDKIGLVGEEKEEIKEKGFKLFNRKNNRQEDKEESGLGLSTKSGSNSFDEIDDVEVPAFIRKKLGK